MRLLLPDRAACGLTRRKNTASKVIMVRESSQEESRAMEITLKSGVIISPMMDGARKKERKAAEVVSDETRSGTASSRADSMAASLAPVPLSIFTAIASDTTMALSTSMPSAMISAASDTWLRPVSNRPMTKRVATMVMGMRLATTRPVRSPRKSSMVASTTATLCRRLPVKSETDLATSKSWDATLLKAIPRGARAWRPATSRSTSLPSWMMLAPSPRATESDSPG